MSLVRIKTIEIANKLKESAANQVPTRAAIADTLEGLSQEDMEGLPQMKSLERNRQRERERLDNVLRLR